jgi:MFS family permease
VFLTLISGGYSGHKQMLKAMKANAVLGVIAALSCMVLIFADCLLYAMILVFVLLFAGGATVPSSTGILVSCVPADLQSYSSSISQLVFNVFGYTLSTLVSGLIMQLSSSRSWGFYSVLLWSLLGTVTSAMAYLAALRANDPEADPVGIHQKTETHTDDSDYQDETSVNSHPQFLVSPNLMMDLAVVQMGNKAHSSHSNHSVRSQSHPEAV